MVIIAADHGVGDGGAQAALDAAMDTGSSLSVAVRMAGATALFVDAGVIGGARAGDVIAVRGGDGCGDIRRAPAMTVDAAEECYAAGLALAQALCEDDIDAMAVGCIGSGGCIAGRAIVGHLIGAKAEAGGRGWDVARTAMARVRGRSLSPGEMLAQLGGFDIAVLAGVIAGAAEVTVVLDDIATWAAAMIAGPGAASVRLGHHGTDPHARAAVAGRFGPPIFAASLGSGDGTGAALALSALRR